MLILVAVTINATISSGLFSKAGEAAQQTKTAMDREENIENEITIGDKTLKEYIKSLEPEVELVNYKIIDGMVYFNISEKYIELIENLTDAEIEDIAAGFFGGYSTMDELLEDGFSGCHTREDFYSWAEENITSGVYNPEDITNYGLLRAFLADQRSDTSFKDSFG